MSYLVLARKYRPQTFEEVVGQNPVSQTLLNALEAGKVAHAYVFSGPRGVGKTTTARLLAKCLNCEKGPTQMPCNKCESCRTISEGTSMDDVLEIDGASNRGIEQIRDLRESAKYAPARSRYRIYIIDEAHQITKDAFGALLKTLEEPPTHVVFMMATTEVQKIPAPILSRCQRFSLRPISADLAFKHLQEICKKEKIKVEDPALIDIVRFVEGSLRDALSLLDQALVFSPEGVTAQTIRDLLGLLPRELVRGTAEILKAGDPAAVLKNINEAARNGVDLTQLGKDLQNYYHHLLLAKAGVEDPFKLESRELAQEAAGYDFETLERNIRLLSRMLEDMRHSEAPRAVFEVYGLRLAQKTLDPRILLERLEKLSAPGERVRADGESYTPPLRPISSRGAESTFSAKSPRPAPGEEIARGVSRGLLPPAQISSPGAGSSVDADFESDILSGWAEFVNDVAQVKQPLAAALEEARPMVQGEGLLLSFQKVFHQQMVVRSIEILKPIFTKRFGRFVPINTRLEKPSKEGNPATGEGIERRGGVYDSPSAKISSPVAEPSLVPTEEPAFEEIAPAEAGTDVQKALKHFPGTIKKERRF